MTIQTIQVSTAAGLLSALKTATGGETIQLSAGKYGGVYLGQYNFAQSVTIKGGDFSSLQVVSSSGIDFEGTHVNFIPTSTSTNNSQGIRVAQSQNIHFNNATLVGGPSVNGVDPLATSGDATGNVLGYPVGKGINFDASSNVSITNSDISMFAKGVTFTGGSNILIDNNDIHDLRTTPISGSTYSSLTISNNHSWDSHPWQFGVQDHGDRIHIWTISKPMTGLVISNNYLDQGNGDPMLGIYLDDNGQNLGFPGAVISGNTVIDGTGQGMLLDNVSGTVSNNKLIWSGYGTQNNNTPRFDISGRSDSISFTDNSGPVSIRAGSTYLDFVRHNGMITEATTMTSADRDTITIDFMVITAHNSYTLDATTSDLYFQGGTGNFVGTGNALANHIVASTGADTLIGNGGADFLEGRTGNDTYVVDNLAQRIYDLGTEFVKSTISWTLQAGLENLTYIGTGAATLAGNSAPNIIIGGTGNDRLIGNGGADNLQGGLGNDTYVIGALSQVITDTGGVDTVEASLNYTLAATLENLTLTGAAVIGTGNAGANVLIGNGLNNTLDGKAGADSMSGGAGNDIYIVDNAGDQVIEIVGGVDSGGNDTLKTALTSMTLSAGVEALAYTGTVGFNGTGNALANYMTGAGAIDKLDGGGGDDRIYANAGNDIINGGSGIDQLTGGTGNDTFVFVQGEANADAILDFNGAGTLAGDVIELRGWGTGSTFTNISGTSNWLIHDGLTGFEEYISVKAVNNSDVVFTQMVTSVAGNSMSSNISALTIDTQGIDMFAFVDAEYDLPPEDTDPGKFAGILDDSSGDAGDLAGFDDADAQGLDADQVADAAAGIFEPVHGEARAAFDHGQWFDGAGLLLASALDLHVPQHVA